MKLAGKVILVTGASSGIGLAAAHALVRHGARVAFAARSADRLAAQVALANSAAGDRALAMPLDVTNDASVEKGIAAITAQFGRLDIVVNNAGNGGHLALWSAADAERTRAMFDVHVLGAERVMRAALPTMLAQGEGTLVNFASTVAWVPMPGAAAYSAAKAAVVALSESLRAELRQKNIDVRVFAPPHTSTEAGNAWPLGLPKIYEPDWVAAQLVSFLEGRAPVAIPGGNRALLWLQRASPRLAARIMERIGWQALGRVPQLRAGSGEPQV